MLLKNKIAVVYGAGGSIGGAVAIAFVREGAKVFLAGRTRPGLERVAKEISEAGGWSHIGEVEAFDDQGIDMDVDTVVKQAGCIDVTFNAIAIDDSIQGTPLIELSPAAVGQPVMQRVMTNFLTARAAARHMIRKGAGVILMITATPARVAWPLTGSFGIKGAAITGR